MDPTDSIKAFGYFIHSIYSLKLIKNIWKRGMNLFLPEMEDLPRKISSINIASRNRLISHFLCCAFLPSFGLSFHRCRLSFLSITILSSFWSAADALSGLQLMLLAVTAHFLDRFPFWFSLPLMRRQKENYYPFELRLVGFFFFGCGCNGRLLMQLEIFTNGKIFFVCCLHRVVKKYFFFPNVLVIFFINVRR